MSSGFDTHSRARLGPSGSREPFGCMANQSGCSLPYFGQTYYPAFGRDQSGLDGIRVPVLEIAGTADTTAPLTATQEGMARLGGSRILVALNGVPHGFDVASTQDIFTWSLEFLAAHVQGDPLARARLARMQKVAGGGDDVTRTPSCISRGESERWLP